MRLPTLALALALMLALCLGQGYPLHGSNGAVNSTVFGAFKEPFPSGDPNAGRGITILNVDLSLLRANATDNAKAAAVYTLVDGNDKVYQMRQDYSKDLQSGRKLVGFIVPKEAVPKSLIVDPTADPSRGNKFVIDFGKLTNSSNGKVKLVYYGIVGSKQDYYYERATEFDIGITNNGTTRLHLSSSNFTLIDQWGWKYNCMPYNGNTYSGFPQLVLKPNETIRTGLIFTSRSPLSRPAKLVYDYSNNSSITISIDSESGLQSNATALKECKQCDCCSQSAENPTTLAGSIKASKARLAKVKQNL